MATYNRVGDTSLVTVITLIKGKVDEVEAKIPDVAGEIEKLDVSDIGGTGKYISTVGETDGKITATAVDFPDIPTVTDTYSSTGTDAVSGKAVASALSGLSKTNTAGSTKYITSLTQTNGKIAYTTTNLITDVSANKTSTTAPTTKSVYDFVTAEIGSISGIKYEIVSTLPTTGATGTIYLVASGSSTTQNIYDEYIWIASTSTYEKIGSTETDLSGYVKATEMKELSATEVTTIFNSVWG